MKNIRLYIGGSLVDLDSKFSVPFTQQIVDMSEPTAVKNSFSKTVQLPCTDSNIQLFANLWRLHGMVVNSGRGIGYEYNPLKRVSFLLYIDENIVERGYCQLLSIERKSKELYYSVGLFGGLGEFFYNLDTDEDGEKRSLASLFGDSLDFTINAAFVQGVWDRLLGGELPDLAFVPISNGVPKAIAADKILLRGGGLPTSIVIDGKTYTSKEGYLLAACSRKYTEWEVGDLRSYLQRPALRLKAFLDAVFSPENNGGWNITLDEDFFNENNPYYNDTYILLPQLDVEEEEEELCDDGKIGEKDEPVGELRTISLTPSSQCMVIGGGSVVLNDVAANAFLRLRLPVQLAIASTLRDRGALYLTNRVSGHTENKAICMMVSAVDDEGNVLAVSNRYVFTSKSHRNEVADLQKPPAPLPTTDAQIEGYFAYEDGGYVFRSDDNPSNVFALEIENIPRPDTVRRRVYFRFYIQRSTQGIDFLNTSRRGTSIHDVAVQDVQIRCKILDDVNNMLTLVEPTQFASESHVRTQQLFSQLKETPLEILLAVTKRFGLMWLQDKQERRLSLLLRKNYYNGSTIDIQDKVDYGRSVKITPVAAESNNYVLEDEYEETTLSKAYESRWGRVYGGVRLKTGYEFGKDKIELFSKQPLQGLVCGALAGSGYWKYSNEGGNLPSAIADGMDVTYYKTEAGETETHDVTYNLFNVRNILKVNSPAMGVACLNEEGEDKAVEVSPTLIFFAGGVLDGEWRLTDDNAAMEILNNGPCYIWDEQLPIARVPRFLRVATFPRTQLETYSLDFGTPKETFYAHDVSLAPEQAIYARFWQAFLNDLLEKNTKKVECYVLLPPHADLNELMRSFFLFERSLWVLNKVIDYDPTKEEAVKCEFIRVNNRNSYK